MTSHEPRMQALGWIPYLGETDSLVSKRILGRYPVRIQDVAEDALDAFEQALIETGYENPCDWTGSYFKRTIAGTDMWSTHAYGTAIDLDYGGGDDEPIDNNPYIRRPIQPADFGVVCQLLERQVRAVEAIKNLDGRSLWRWLGWSIGDTMHFQIDVSPNACQVDWSTVAGYVSEGDDDLTITDLVTDETWQALWDAGHIDGDPAVMPDYYFADGPASDAEKLNGYNVAIQSLARSQPASQELIDQVNLIEASLDDTQTKLRSV